MSTEAKTMDAFEALEQAGFSEELLNESHTSNGRPQTHSIKHKTLDICVGMLTRYPKPFDFEAQIDVSILFVFCDSCAEFTEDVSKQLTSLMEEYGATTWLNMGNEWEYFCWDDKTGYEGFLRFIREIDSFAARLPKVPGVVTFGAEPTAES